MHGVFSVLDNAHLQGRGEALGHLGPWNLDLGGEAPWRHLSAWDSSGARRLGTFPNQGEAVLKVLGSNGWLGETVGGAYRERRLRFKEKPKG